MPKQRGGQAGDLAAALDHLRADSAIFPLLEGVGPVSLGCRRAPSPLHSLAASITGQQLSGRAADAIFARFLALYGGSLDPQAILDTPEDDLRAAGLSRAKAAAMHDLAEKTKSGLIPGWPGLRRMGDEDIIRLLTRVKGVGRWTVEMMLIFCLGRPDVWPVGDSAIRKAYGLLFGITDPEPAEMTERAEPWRPWRSVVARYLWKSLDATEQPSPRRSRAAPQKK